MSSVPVKKNLMRRSPITTWKLGGLFLPRPFCGGVDIAARVAVAIVHTASRNKPTQYFAHAFTLNIAVL